MNSDGANDVNGVAENDVGYDPNANYDDLVLRHEKEITKEVEATQQLIGDVEPLTALLTEYSSHEAYPTQIRALLSRLSPTWEETPTGAACPVTFRRVRKDGNCFYRAVAFAICERLLVDGSTTAIAELNEALNEVRRRLVDEFGYPQFTVDDFCDAFVDLVEEIRTSKTTTGENEATMTLDRLVATFREQANSDYYMVYMRMATAKQIRVDEEFFRNFLLIADGVTAKQFCDREVEPPNREADHLHIVALTRALSIHLTVHYLDQQNASAIEFPDNDGAGAVGGGASDTQTPHIHLLYRPGHYDILYPPS